MKKYINLSVMTFGIMMSMLLAVIVANVSHAAVPQYPSGMLAIHRFYNVKTLTHFYTPDENEASVIRATLPDFRYEGIKYNAYSQPASDRIAVHRFYNIKTLSHFYTSDQNEVNVIRSTMKDFVYEGVSYYANDSGVGGSSKAVVYRFYNQKTLTHLYTSDPNEVSVIRGTLRDYSYEGAKFAAPESRYFNSCSDAKYYGLSPLYRGQIGYGTHLDANNDGMACETTVETNSGFTSDVRSAGYSLTEEPVRTEADGYIYYTVTLTVSPFYEASYGKPTLFLQLNPSTLNRFSCLNDRSERVQYVYEPTTKISVSCRIKACPECYYNGGPLPYYGAFGVSLGYIMPNGDPQGLTVGGLYDLEPGYDKPR